MTRLDLEAVSALAMKVDTVPRSDAPQRLPRYVGLERASGPVYTLGMRRLLASVLVLVLVTACSPGGAPPRSPDTAPPRAPGAPATSAGAPSGDPFAIEGTLEEESLPLLKPPVFDLNTMPLPAAPKGVPPAPPKCAEIAKRKGAGAIPAASCKDTAGAQNALDKALSEADPGRRDALLVDVEACAGLPVGLTRALRTELAPTECADVMAEPLASSPPKTMTGIVYHACDRAGIAMLFTGQRCFKH